MSAVFRLKQRGTARKTAGPVPTPEATEAAARRAIERATRAVGRPPDRFNVFRNLGAFVVSGSPSLITELMAQPEVAGAVANRRQDQELLIRPVKRARAGSPRKKAPETSRISPRSR